MTAPAVIVGTGVVEVTAAPRRQRCRAPARRPGQGRFSSASDSIQSACGSAGSRLAMRRNLAVAAIERLLDRLAQGTV